MEFLEVAVHFCSEFLRLSLLLTKPYDLSMFMFATLGSRYSSFYIRAAYSALSLRVFSLDFLSILKDLGQFLFIFNKIGY